MYTIFVTLIIVVRFMQAGFDALLAQCTFKRLLDYAKPLFRLVVIQSFSTPISFFKRIPTQAQL